MNTKASKIYAFRKLLTKFYNITAQRSRMTSVFFFENIPVLKVKDNIQYPYKYRYAHEGYGGQLFGPFSTQAPNIQRNYIEVPGACTARIFQNTAGSMSPSFPG